MIFTSPGIINCRGLEALRIGDTFERTLTIAANLTGYSVRWFAKENESDSDDDAIFDFVSGVDSELTLTPGASSVVTLKIPKTTTDAFEVIRDAYQEVKLSLGGDTTPILIGTIDFLRNLPR